MWVPCSAHYCGQLNVHDMVWGEDGLVGVNTLFSCLFRLDDEFSFRPVWTPPFISALASEDRCHLNGLALAPAEGEVAFATALGASDERGGWRERKLDGGVLLSVPEGERVLEGLAMPHSPRWVEGELYLLLAARGELVAVDVDEGGCEVMQRLPGFARGWRPMGTICLWGCHGCGRDGCSGTCRWRQARRSVAWLSFTGRAGQWEKATSITSTMDLPMIIIVAMYSNHSCALSLAWLCSKCCFDGAVA